MGISLDSLDSAKHEVARAEAKASLSFLTLHI